MKCETNFVDHLVNFSEHFYTPDVLTCLNRFKENIIRANYLQITDKMSDREIESRKRKIKHVNDTSSNDDSYGNHGRWTAEEHQLFLEAINQFGREWDKVQAVVKSRSLAQVRSHAQKYFLKLSKNEELEKLSEYELWNLDGYNTTNTSGNGLNHGEHANAFMVLDLMGSILKKLKSKRDEILNSSGYSTHQDSRSSSSSSSSASTTHYDDMKSDDYQHLHHFGDNGFNELQKAIEQLDAKTYKDIAQIYDEKKLETNNDTDEEI